MRRRAGQQGAVLIALLATMLLMGFTLMAAADIAASARQREREAQLMFIGEQYRQAIERYYYSAPPGTPRVLPSRVDQLIRDDRYPVPVQHLRREYADPFDGGEWVWVRIGDRLAGVHSRAHVEPMKRAGFPSRYAAFASAGDVSQWIFIFKPPTRAAPAAAGPPKESAPAANISMPLNRDTNR